MKLFPADVEKYLSRQPDWDRLGEEGKLYRLGVDGEARHFYAKLWHSLRPQGGVGRRTFVGMPITSGLSVFSPYFHKRVFYEYKLIHTLFPDNTLELMLAYDQRISKSSDGDANFTIRGYPVTLSYEVDSDAGLMEIRDAILNPVYERIHAARDRIHRGDPSANAASELVAAVASADREIAAQFGAELGLIGVNCALTPQLVNQLVQEPSESGLKEFLRCGIMPIHPAFNFIPQSREKQWSTPCGTFIELRIFDFATLRSGARDKCADRLPYFDNLISRFKFYSMLDELFDSVFRDPAVSGLLMRHTFLQTALFCYTEQVRVAFNRDYPGLARELAAIQTSLRGNMMRHCREAENECPSTST